MKSLITSLLFAIIVGINVAAQAQRSSYLPELQRALAQADSEAINRITAQILASDSTLQDLLTVGGLLGEQDYLEQSAAIFERCVINYPESFEAHYNLAFASIALHQNTRAEEALKSVTPSSSTEQAALQYLHGKIYGATGHLKEARDRFESAYHARPDQENYALDLAMLDLRSSAYVPAINVLQQASTYHPESQVMNLELALAYALTGRIEDATALCRKLEKAGSESSVPALIAAFAWCRTGDYQGCSEEALRGLRLPHPHPYLHYLHAMAEWNGTSPNADNILHELTIALKEIPGCQVCFQLRSRVFESVRDYRAAIRDLETAVEQDSSSPATWYRLSELYKKVGENEKSAGAISRFRSIHHDQANQELESFRDQVIGKPDPDSPIAEHGRKLGR